MKDGPNQHRHLLHGHFGDRDFEKRPDEQLPCSLGLGFRALTKALSPTTRA